MMNKVYVDEDLKEVIPGFLSNREQDIEKLREAVTRGEIKTIAFLGHGLKGVGSGYGFDEVTSMGRSIEACAKENDMDGVSLLVEKLAEYMSHIEIIYVEED